MARGRRSEGHVPQPIGRQIELLHKRIKSAVMSLGSGYVVWRGAGRARLAGRYFRGGRAPAGSRGTLAAAIPSPLVGGAAGDEREEDKKEEGEGRGGRAVRKSGSLAEYPLLSGVLTQRAYCLFR